MTDNNFMNQKLSTCSFNLLHYTIHNLYFDTNNYSRDKSHSTMRKPVNHINVIILCLRITIIMFCTLGIFDFLMTIGN